MLTRAHQHITHHKTESRRTSKLHMRLCVLSGNKQTWDINQG